MVKLILQIISICSFFIIPEFAFAEIRLDKHIHDNMVIQRGAPLVISGGSDNNDAFTINFLGNNIHIQPIDNKWSTIIDISNDIYGKTKLIIDNGYLVKTVIIGDVWLCSGQSNMVFPLNNAIDKEQILKMANDKLISTLQVSNKSGSAQSRDSQWQSLDSAKTQRFSAVCLAFGTYLNDLTGVPIGLINASVGGTRIESWISSQNIKNVPCANADTQNELFNLMISPLTSQPIKGVLWYQGESNRGQALCYSKLLSTLISDWRELWHNPELPFVIIQLPGFGRQTHVLNTSSNWAALRDSQRIVASSSENTGLVVTLGLGDGTIHPAQKLPFGQRAATVAYDLAYMKLKYPNILPTSFKTDGNSLVVEFNNGHACTSGSHLTGLFHVAGEDNLWHIADVDIKNSAIIARSPNVSKPVAIRYAWSDNPAVGLQSCENGIPVTPFRWDCGVVPSGIKH